MRDRGKQDMFLWAGRILKIEQRGLNTYIFHFEVNNKL